MSIEPRIFNEPRLRAMMERRGVDALMLQSAVNTKYLSGFFHNGGDHPDGGVKERPFVVLYFLDAAKEPVLIVPSLDVHLALVSTWIEDVRGYVTGELFTNLEVHLYEDFFDAARAVLAERGVANMTVGIEGGQLSKGFQSALEELLAGNRIVDVGRDLGLVRMVKTPEERRRIRQAVDWTVKAHESFRAAIRPGATDRELYSAAARRMIDEGSEGPRFIFMGAGPTRFAANAPFPTGHELAEGDFVKADMGASCLGYAADFVRSYFVGRCPEGADDLWRRLNEVLLETARSIRPGETAGEIYERGVGAITRHIERFPREFIGHGIGLVLNEEPRLNAGSRVEIEPGTVMCVEFSAYLAGGARPHAEDMIHVTERGVELWTEDYPRELVVPAQHAPA